MSAIIYLQGKLTLIGHQHFRECPKGHGSLQPFQRQTLFLYRAQELSVLL